MIVSSIGVGASAGRRMTRVSGGKTSHWIALGAVPVALVLLASDSLRPEYVKGRIEGGALTESESASRHYSTDIRPKSARSYAAFEPATIFKAQQTVTRDG